MTINQDILRSGGELEPFLGNWPPEDVRTEQQVVFDQAFSEMHGEGIEDSPQALRRALDEYDAHKEDATDDEALRAHAAAIAGVGVETLSSFIARMNTITERRKDI